jgi:hypothetical protein
VEPVMMFLKVVTGMMYSREVKEMTAWMAATEMMY